MGWRLVERRYTGKTYYNRYLFFLGLAILIYGLVSKYFGYATDYSTALIGGVVCVLGGFFPMVCALIIWFIGGVNIFIFASIGSTFQLSAVPSEVWIQGFIFFVIGLIIARSSRYTGATYEDIYEKTDPWY